MKFATQNRGPTGDVAAFFDAVASRYDRVYAPSAFESRARMRRVTRELPAAPARILDLGVGTGRELPALLDAGYRPTGLDVSRAMLALCARRARPIDLVHADFWKAPLPFDDGAFDAAIALHGTLCHPEDSGAVARLSRELGRVVRPAGRFVAEVPSIAWLEAAAAFPNSGEQRVTRTGPRTCLYEDDASGVAVRARLLDEAEWLSALAPDWRARVETAGAFEWLVVADRT